MVRYIGAIDRGRARICCSRMVQGGAQTCSSGYFVVLRTLGAFFAGLTHAFELA